ncbi:MAG TPA: ATP-binding protein [Steroidobacteraceae bacterium]|jgi:signal transduction histidine kinase|nr:ATP-binding protein [Steroidobacteraceae bacterium]
MKLAGADRNRRLITAGAGTALAVVMGLALLAGFRLATQIRSSITALQTASELQTYPGVIAQQLTALRERLETREYTGQAHGELTGTVERFNDDIQKLAGRGSLDSPQLQQALRMWQEYNPVLAPVIAFSGEPYIDTDSGSSLTESGKAYYGNVRQAQLLAKQNVHQLHQLLATVTRSLGAQASSAAARLRALLSGGVLAALALAFAAAYLQLTRAKHERAAREAQEQTRDMLKTVREGFFLLDADYKIGSVWSEALTRIFGRSDFAGLAFEKLLEDRVPPNTLATAVKYIKLLWGDRAHENLMKSINPLGQLEISMDNGRGGKETRYLQFDFHRVTGPKGAVKHVLCSVGDITSNVLLAKELQEAQENANAQVDMMVGMLHVDSLQLGSFLDTTETGLQLINAILKEPARTDAEFRKKLGGLFRELHSIKGEASALNLMSIAHRVHHLEDTVSELKKKAELSGNDFLPMVLKLDDLLAHLRGVREMATRLTALKEPAAAAAQGAPARPKPSQGPRSGEDISPTLQALAEKLAKDHRKPFKLALSGLADVPAAYVTTVKDCVIQMLRNSAVHGIEPSETRRAQAKADVGVVRIDFRRLSEGYELIFEDDGAGISPQTLKQAAVRKNIITAEEAASMDTRAAMSLIFRPGFSTQDQVTMDAGRGVGMDVVARTVYGLGGKIGVSTNPGRFTRFKIVLPAAEAASSAVA